LSAEARWAPGLASLPVARRLCRSGRHPAPFDPDCEAAHSEGERTKATLCLDRSEEGPMERWSEIHPVEERSHASLENLVFALGEVAGADRSSLFVVDEEHSQLWLAVAKTDGQPLDVRMPLGRGVAGLAWKRGEPIRVDEAYAFPHFNREVDA